MDELQRVPMLPMHFPPKAHSHSISNLLRDHGETRKRKASPERSAVRLTKYEKLDNSINDENNTEDDEIIDVTCVSVDKNQNKLKIDKINEGLKLDNKSLPTSAFRKVEKLHSPTERPSTSVDNDNHMARNMSPNSWSRVAGAFPTRNIPEAAIPIGITAGYQPHFPGLPLDLRSEPLGPVSLATTMGKNFPMKISDARRVPSKGSTNMENNSVNMHMFDIPLIPPMGAKVPMYPDVRLPFQPQLKANNPMVERLLTMPPQLPSSANMVNLSLQNWCAKCNATFRMTSDLVYHMRSHHKREFDLVKRKRDEKLKCTVCNETFKERHHLTRHMSSHT